ncbi:outer membrane beta-barrel protein [Mucilaginibacter auburnensis]|uniref:Outer membrane protein with beta-barrel domain n=1 Tax=Mucilaginibacter auburnensis TaxID=1457233 RepID=A0A2H9VSX4_9SPHI|nr:outer membrane beta-barrel protein [Mucilaginibacter auburnensis]PJJ83916.1 outer membrane protein with beta-barrel domain [Mucilaginibacter auburnensis]
MKRFILAAAIAMVAGTALAQDTTIVKTIKNGDTTTVTTIEKKQRIKFSFGDRKAKVDSVRKARAGKPGFNFGVTFSRVDIGLATLVDNGSFTLSPQNDFLRYRSWKTSNFGFDLVQFGYRFNNNFKMYISGGFDWTHIRLRENITIQKGGSSLTYIQDNVEFSKNRFSSTYIRVPLSFEFRSSENSNGKRFRFVTGPEASFLMGGKVKQISEERGKQKIEDDYHFTRLRLGAVARVGYGGAGIYAKYYFTDMFENSPAQAGLKNFSFGFTFGF